jgi:hypothetical protein
MTGDSVADVVRSALPDAAGALLNGYGAAPVWVPENSAHGSGGPAPGGQVHEALRRLPPGDDLPRFSTRSNLTARTVSVSSSPPACAYEWLGVPMSRRGIEKLRQVILTPVFSNLTTFQAVDLDTGEVQGSVARWNTHQFTLMCAAKDKSHGNLIPTREDVLDIQPVIRKPGLHLLSKLHICISIVAETFRDAVDDEI